ncbi:hypothetical protein STCU_04667 [Strigomonas culicis]|uniref:Uncharacterized protein n=1 Tax=Strigomonas culicis TaxID=28005 RepID=S9VZZ6_9TRYP|nr:hypothetical protein STCU_04667 [Strigomonas culicis]|eukprot:EPY29215.1 hypothetical protein STCU_04667 [Strigomonas culicis]
MMKLTIVGAGVSCAVPVIGHIEMPRAGCDAEGSAKTLSCCCDDAFRNPHSKNKRNNVSLLIELPIPAAPQRAADEEAGGTNSVTADDPIRILIDCGKTFRDAYQRVLAPKQVSYVDVLLLTHGHADAMHCTQELCEMQAEASTQLALSHSSSGANAFDRLRCLRAVPTFLTLPTLREVEAVSPSLAASSTICETIKDRTYSILDSAEGGDAGASVEQLEQQKEHADVNSPTGRPHTALDIHLVPEDVPVRLHPYMDVLQHYLAPAGAAAFPFPMYTLPVEHGRNYISLGFVFGSGTAFVDASEGGGGGGGGSCVIYLSDISAIPAASLHFLRRLERVDVLIVDLLAEKGTQSPPHYCWDDIMPVVRLLSPHKVYCVGMFCSLDYASANALWVVDLEEEKARLRDALARPEGPLPPVHLSGAPAPEAWTAAEARRRAERFVACTESIELAYDGQELELPM